MLPVLIHSRRPHRGKHRGRDMLSSRATQAFQDTRLPAEDVLLIPNHQTHEDTDASSEAPVNFSNPKTKSRPEPFSFKSRNQTHMK